MKNMVIKPFAGLIAFMLIAALWSCALPLPKWGSRPDYVAPVNEGARNLALSDMEKDVVRQINELRTDPKAWASRLKTLKSGAEETEEAVLLLNNRTALPILKVSRGLCLAARELLIDHGPRGLTGHKGSDGSTAFTRMNKYGQWDGKAAENLYFGYKDADRLMNAALTEGGTGGWEQRNNLLNKDFNVMGIACGPHHVYRVMCVINFAGTYVEMP